MRTGPLDRLPRVPNLYLPVIVFGILDVGLLGLIFVVTNFGGPWWLALVLYVVFGVLSLYGCVWSTRWGVLCERDAVLRSAVGRWSLSRSDAIVTGWLMPHDRRDAERFAYAIKVELDEASGDVDITVTDRTSGPKTPGSQQ